ncbi:MAG TPA: hypothetical protein VLC28_02545, partial [Flavitalea sp.]|nr:hypothetical protein [Flavitalea sp.]
MTLKTGIFNNLFWRSLQIISTLVLNILVARYLGAAESGSVYYLITIYTLYIQVGGLSLESAIGFFTLNNRIPIRSLAAGALGWTVIVTSLAITVSLFSNHKTPASNTEHANMAMFIAGTLLTNYFSSIFFAKMNFKIPNLYGTAINVVLSIGIGILLLQHTSVINSSLITVFFFSFLLRGLFMVFCFYRDREHRGKPAWI